MGQMVLKMTLDTLTMTWDDFPGVWGPQVAQIAFKIFLAPCVGIKMFYSDTVYYSLWGGGQRGNGWSRRSRYL